MRPQNYVNITDRDRELKRNFNHQPEGNRLIGRPRNPCWKRARKFEKI